MAYMCVRYIAGLQICGCDACRTEKGWTPNDPPRPAGQTDLEQDDLDDMDEPT